MGDGSMLMIHNVWSFMILIGDADELESNAKKEVNAMRSLTKNAASMIAKRTSKTVKEVSEWMSDETWFDAKEAVEQGFAESVVEVKENAKSEVSDKARSALLAWKLGIRNTTVHGRV